MQNALKDYKVKQIQNFEVKEWLLEKHYARRLCPISYAFGLADTDNNLAGVITFGCPPNKEYNDGKCIFYKKRVKTLELNRLVINSNAPKNTASFFIMQAIKQLPAPMALVSYADANYNHHGYVYQATNWLYTGTSAKKHRYTFEDGTTFDMRRDVDKKGRIVNTEELMPTYRYIYLHGNKKEKKDMKRDMKWDVKAYPKGNNKNYECVDINAKTQKDLFD
tara:strand:+ start:2554 stop:3216 length:663 start_codon:yes stop_codon:yes gene_type:complete